MNLSMQTTPAILGGQNPDALSGRGNAVAPAGPGRRASGAEGPARRDLSLHPVTRELEDDYRNYFGSRYALAHCNGTAALLAAFFALDLQPGDEVLVPSATFWASVVPMLWVGACPVFCESEFDRLGLDPVDVAKRITPRTRAIVVTHLWGMPAKMTEILALARKHNLKVIEDASHAQGAVWRNRPVEPSGTFRSSVFRAASWLLPEKAACC